MPDALQTLRGVARSLRIYYGDRSGRELMRSLYSRFIKPGDLVLDIGAHVGDRIGVFRKLGARVVAVEPQPALVRTLKFLYGRDGHIVIEPVAVSRSPGVVDLWLNPVNPTVATASTAFLKAARGAAGWEGQRWSSAIAVTATTLDALIARHGTPSFVKIDVEGLEADVLAALSHPIQALSFEFTTIMRGVARDGVEQCVRLGFTRYNAVLGETHSLIHAHWLDAAAIMAWVASLPHRANSGDIYAVQESVIRNQ
jgi:FkbM family methyltransferase